MSTDKLNSLPRQNEINRRCYKDRAARIDLEYWEWLCGEDGILFGLELDFGEQEGFQ